jgi:hypothetical protein
LRAVVASSPLHVSSAVRFSSRPVSDGVLNRLLRRVE